FLSSRRRHTRSKRDWSSDVCSSDLNVALVARSEDKLSLLAEQINNQGNGKAISIPTDVSIREEVETMVEKVTSEFGGIEYFVNNAGVMLSGAVTDRQVQDWEKMIDVNIKGILYGSNAIIPQMLEKKSGHIINIASVSGFEVS